MQSSKRKTQRKFFGMTSVQISILTVMGLFIITIFVVGIALVVNNTSETHTSVDFSLQPIETPIKAISSPTLIASVTLPPTWTPTSKPTAEPATPTPRPSITPMPTQTSVATWTPHCIALSKFINDTKPYIDQFNKVESHYHDLVKYNQDTGKYLDPTELRGMANDLYRAAASIQIVDTTAELLDIRNSLVEGVNLGGDSLWDWAYAFELRVSPLNQQYAQSGLAKQNKSLNILSVTITTITNQSNMCWPTK